jgi:glycerol-3-phosphate dehydrogenase
MWKLAKDLDFPIKQNGHLVVATSESELPTLTRLLEQGIKNGVPGVRIIYREELLRKEPNLTDSAVAALFSPKGGIICPFNLAIATAENASANGAEFRFNVEVLDILKTPNGYLLKTDKGDEETKAVVNAAGVYADKFHNAVSGQKIHITARRGEYLLFDKTCGDLFSCSVFPVPSKMGKGILTAPTVHGNLYVGPSAENVEDKESVLTTAEILKDLVEKAKTNHLCKYPLPLNKIITAFSGLRAQEDGDDFIIGEVPDAKFFFDAAGIKSPGLAAAPAIGEALSKEISEKLSLVKKENFISTRKGVTRFESLSKEDKEKIIKENPAYGNIVCRCETITEGEIIDAINRPLGAKSLDAVKRRTRAGMGRCQAGFCSPKTTAILARELGVEPTEITKKGGASQILIGRNKAI